MAKRRRKKSKPLAANLKYEVYGILIMTLSVIALSGEASVGRNLTNLFAMLLGKFYFVFPLVGIYVGLAVMVKRKWPSGWSARKTGVLLFVLALALWSAIEAAEDRLGPSGELGTGAIMALGHQIWDDTIRAGSSAAPVGERNISGGYIGVVEYAFLYSLFGESGAKLLRIVMIFIAVMLIFGLSYVELGRTVKQRAGRLFRLLRHKFASGRLRSGGVLPAALPSARKDGGAPVVALDDEDDLPDDDELPLPRQERRTPQFFTWLQETARPKSRKSRYEPENADDEDDDGEPVILTDGNWRQTTADEDGDIDTGAIHAPSAATGASPLGPEAAGLPWEDLDGEPEHHRPQAWQEEGAADDFPAGEQEAFPPEADAEADAAPAAPPAGEPQAEAAPAAARPAAPKPRPYRLPPLSLLARPQHGGKSGPSDTTDSRRKLEATLESFGVKANVLDVVRGPAVTRYEVQPATGVKVSRIVSLTDDIALALAAKDIRMEAPIPGKSAIGIEVPNTEVSMVTMREVMESPAFQQAPSKLSIAFGRDISGQPIVGNLARMPHLLVAGATGSGKSVCINGIITSILYKAAPDEVKFLMVDPKMVELNVYNGIPHLLAPVVTDPRRASLALKKIVVEMEKRYELFSKSGTRNIEGYNTLMADNPAALLPYIVVIVDELADLMMVAANDVEDAITRLAQMARAAGIHLIIATQRPSVDVITGVIKANIPSRIAFGVSSQVDSRTILDMVGAEKLLGRGDMLFLPVGMSKPIRVQGAFLSDQEVEAIVTFARGQAEAEYKEDLVPEIEDAAAEDDDELDELFDQAVQIVVEAKQASVSLLQRRMRVGYTRAARLIDQMEAKGVVGPYEGSKPREVLLTIDQYQAGKISS